ncbi:MAG: MBL fold metallo-hydrolase [Clostridia bacterium]|nr:MBL fold metallo-hydrolase [Clostridia bacterium]
MKIHLLGVNGPFPESGGATSGYLLETDRELIQFDLGSGILSRLTARTAPEALSAICLSHWHYDHTADLPVLLYRLQALGKQIRIYAPEDESSPVFRLVSSEPSFILTSVRPGDSFQIGDLTLTAGPARHPVPTVGYRIHTAEADWGYTGDTNTHPDLVSFYQDCRLLLCDGLFPAESWGEQKPHLSASLAAQLAADASCEQLVLTQLNPCISPRVLLEEARALHPRVTLARAGERLTL